VTTQHTFDDFFPRQARAATSTPILSLLGKFGGELSQADLILQLLILGA
jgi:hypothetical protein